MMFFIKIKFQIVVFVIILTSVNVYSQKYESNNQLKFGAYYFDGWNGQNKYQLSTRLVSDYNERKPIWGWVTSTQMIMDEQINLASKYGFSFFNFCWYHNYRAKQKIGGDIKNNALSLYLKSPNKSKLEFTIMVANHKGYEFRKSDWRKMTFYWIKLFKDPKYLKVDGKPLITFFNITGIVKTFNGADSVKIAFDSFRKQCKEAGLSGVTIAGVLSPTNSSVQIAEKSGYDVLTGYNYHANGFSGKQKGDFPIENMQKAEQLAWTKFGSLSSIPLIPAVTLNWDQRPQEQGKVNISSRYTGFSGNSVSKSIAGVKTWMGKETDKVTKEKIINVYAWNEYGEGAWLTPSDKLGYSLLDGFSDALKN